MVTNSNRISRKRAETTKRLIQALRETQGLQALAARKAGVRLDTLQRYAREFPSVKEAVMEAKENTLDFAEGKLYEKIKAGNMTAIIFYLKTQGKHRGYIERAEFDTTVSGRIQHEVTIKFETTDLRDALQSLVECRALSIASPN